MTTTVPTGEKTATGETWTFTFGADHRHPTTGERLSQCYVRVPGDIETSREAMLATFGRAWSNQYPNPEAARAARYGLREIPFPGAAEKAVKQAPPAELDLREASRNGVYAVADEIAKATPGGDGVTFHTTFDGPTVSAVYEIDRRGETLRRVRITVTVEELGPDGEQ